jgi:uncharacterized SAM-binding protein YcdF (DUF218 family)
MVMPNMSVPTAPHGDHEPGRPLPPAGPVRHPIRNAVLAIALAAVAAFCGGFIWFTRAVPVKEVTLTDRADGIVVLTGGASRITDAIELLADGHGKRLLISGVHPATSEHAIARVVPRYSNLLKCCVDLDHSAVNTVGNAAGTRRWVKSRNIRSLIVVTSNYHMPRSMAELERQLPGVRLIAYPVVTDRMRTESWWTLPTAKLLLSEYLKYMLAQVRMRIEPDPDLTDVARAHDARRS